MLEVVGHRAFRAKYPENTLLGYNKAYEAGVSIIETDLQMTSDGVVVINHDADTGRCWSANMVVANHTYEELYSRLRNKMDKSIRLITLKEALEWSLDHPNVKLMLDIKFTNNKLIMIKAYATMLSVSKDLAYWKSHILWGLWLLDWYEYGYKTGVLKDFPIVVISLSLDVAQSFINYSVKLDNPHYKLYGISIHYVASWTERYRAQLSTLVAQNDIKVFLWTVNKAIDLKFASQLPNIYAVLVDDPVQAKQLLSEYHRLSSAEEENAKFQVPALTSIYGLRFHAFLKIYNFVCHMLFSPWAHYQVFGWSLAYIVFMFLRLVHFL